MFAKPKNAV